MKRVDIRVVGINLHGESAQDRLLREISGDVYWHQTGSLTTATVFSDGNLVHDACELANRFQHHVDGARFDRVDDDLVGITDIARRVDVSRELVRLWSSGERGPGDFPSPRGLIGSSGSKGATKIWAWADVNRWLEQIGLDDGFDHANDAEVAQINSYLARVPEVLSADEVVFQVPARSQLLIAEVIDIPTTRGATTWSARLPRSVTRVDQSRSAIRGWPSREKRHA